MRGTSEARTWRPTDPTDVHLTLRPLRRGRADPTYQVSADGALWRTTRMPSGPATMRITQRGSPEVTCEAWGSGAAEVLDTVPMLLGECDDPASFDPQLSQLSDAHPAYGPRSRITHSCCD